MASLDDCPTCGRRIRDYDLTGCEVPGRGGQRYCVEHLPKQFTKELLNPQDWWKVYTHRDEHGFWVHDPEGADLHLYRDREHEKRWLAWHVSDDSSLRDVPEPVPLGIFRDMNRELATVFINTYQPTNEEPQNAQ